MSRLSQKEHDRLPARKFSFPEQRKEPTEDAGHFRVPAALLMQVKDVTDEERDKAWRRSLATAKSFGVDNEERYWCKLT